MERMTPTHRALCRGVSALARAHPVGLVPISERTQPTPQRSKRTQDAGLRVETDNRNEKMIRKDPRLRQSEDAYILVFGDKRSAKRRQRAHPAKATRAHPLADFIAKAKDLAP